jgi:competence protein ComEC
LGNSDNESGISVLFSGENCDILITGDMSALGERLLLMSHQIPKLEVLVAGHHGADSSTSERLLEQTWPDTVMISVGEDNRYGHPAQSVMDRLTKFGCEIRRTDKEGTIVFRR